MNINLLSMFSSRTDGAAPATALGETANAATDTLSEADIALGAEEFGQLFEGQIAELSPEEMKEIPAPQLLAAFLQRLTTIVPEDAAVAEPVLATPVLEDLTADQINTLSQILGVDASVLNLESALSAEQLLPQASPQQQDDIAAVVFVLQELARLGQKMHQEGLSLVEIPAVPVENVVFEAAALPADDSASIISLLALDSDVPQVQPFEVSEETIVALANLFQLPEAEIRQNIAQIHLVDIDAIDSLNFAGIPIVDIAAFSNDLKQQATEPGLVQLIASVLNKPAGEVWEQLEDITGDELEIPLGIVLASVVSPLTAEKTPATLFNFDQIVGRAGDKIAPLPLTPNSAFSDVPELAGRKVLGNLPLPNLTQAVDTAAAAAAAENSPFKFLPSHRQQISSEGTQAASFAGAIQPNVAKEGESSARNRIDALAPLPSADKSPLAASITRSDKQDAAPGERSRQLSAAVAQSREANARSAVPLRENSIKPLLREALDRPIAQQAPLDSSSSLAFTANDSKLNFDAKLREARSFNNRQAANPSNVREQVMVQVKHGIARGDSQINVRLNPSELGRVDVRLEVVDGRTTVTVFADNRDTLEMLQRDSRSLEKAFQEMGMQMSDSGMSFDLNQQSTDQQEQDSHQENANSESNSFEAMLASPDEMIAEALLDGGPLSYSVGVDDGLNIKV